MAKQKKKVDNTSRPPDTFKNLPDYIRVATKEDKQEKEGGKLFVLDADWFVPGYMKPLLPGSQFRECNDGWYQVHNEQDVKMCYRLKAALIKEIFEREPVDAKD